MRTFLLTTAISVAAVLLPQPTTGYNKSSFTATFSNPATLATDSEYEILFSWDHDYGVAPLVTKALDKNPKRTGGACDPEADFTASDGQPYWMPRFFPTAVPAEVTEVTGIKFVSPDWQPCGHKDILICHGESHYDFHLYYQEEEAVKREARCDRTAGKPGHYIICDDNTAWNHRMFKLMQSDIPISRTSSARSPMAQPHTAAGNVKQLSYCVDPTSGVPQSGIHYGDKAETVSEWKEPVSIMGSHDCALTFFEPMISWNWITDKVRGGKSWPTWDSGEIEYNRKTFQALPTSWRVHASPGCKGGDMSKTCTISVTVRGQKCPAGGCTPPTRNCGNQNDCFTGSPYVSPFSGAAAEETTTPISVTQSPEQSNTDGEGQPVVVTGSTPSTDPTQEQQEQQECDDTLLGGELHCFTADGKTIIRPTNVTNQDNNSKFTQDPSVGRTTEAAAISTATESATKLADTAIATSNSAVKTTTITRQVPGDFTKMSPLDVQKTVDSVKSKTGATKVLISAGTTRQRSQTIVVAMTFEGSKEVVLASLPANTEFSYFILGVEKKHTASKAQLQAAAVEGGGNDSSSMASAVTAKSITALIITGLLFLF